MDVILIFNGLGNQMSQYAFYLAKKDRGCNCICMFDPSSNKRHNGSELNQLFGVKLIENKRTSFLKFLLMISRKRGGTKLLKIFGIRFINEPLNYNYSSSNLDPGQGWLNFYIGGWHSEKYFFNIRKKILYKYRFEVGREDDAEFVRVAEEIKQKKNNSVSIHVRRGDYLNSKPNDPFQYDGVATISYYNESIAYFKKKTESPFFYIFSNDIDWCKRNFIGSEFYFVECNIGEKSWRDLYLMSLCKHHIIANSSFSWWGAWLSDDVSGITVRPRRFLANRETKDFYPEDWITIG